LEGGRRNKRWKRARSRIDDSALLKQAQRLLEKLLLFRRHGMSLWRDTDIKTNHPFPPPGQINQQIIRIGARPLHMYQSATLKIEMQGPHPCGISQREATSTTGAANPGNNWH
jgi:hypothetical protein